jgi:hypothetical protein
VYDALDIRNIGGGKRLKGLVPPIQHRRHSIDTRIRALGRKARSKQQLIILHIIKRAKRLRVTLLQQPYYLKHFIFKQHPATPSY